MLFGLTRWYSSLVVAGIVAVVLVVAGGLSTRRATGWVDIPTSPRTSLNERADANLARLGIQKTTPPYAYVAERQSSGKWKLVPATYVAPAGAEDEPPEEREVHRQIEAELPPKR